MGQRKLTLRKRAKLRAYVKWWSGAFRRNSVYSSEIYSLTVCYILGRDDTKTKRKQFLLERRLYSIGEWGGRDSTYLVIQTNFKREMNSDQESGWEPDWEAVRLEKPFEGESQLALWSGRTVYKQLVVYWEVAKNKHKTKHTIKVTLGHLDSWCAKKSDSISLIFSFFFLLRSWVQTASKATQFTQFCR